jgi:hypothetical protein
MGLQNTTIVFTDGGDGEVEGLEYAKNGAGIYTHVAMLDGVANQLTEMVPTKRIFGSISNFLAKNATSIFVLNVSDLLPYIMGCLANFRAIYSPQAYLCNASLPGECDAVAASFVASWAQSTFLVSPADGASLARAYGIYFNVSACPAERSSRGGARCWMLEGGRFKGIGLALLAVHR